MHPACSKLGGPFFPFKSELSKWANFVDPVVSPSLSNWREPMGQGWTFEKFCSYLFEPCKVRKVPLFPPSNLRNIQPWDDFLALTAHHQLTTNLSGYVFCSFTSPPALCNRLFFSAGTPRFQDHHSAAWLEILEVATFMLLIYGNRNAEEPSGFQMKIVVTNDGKHPCLKNYHHMFISNVQRHHQEVPTSFSMIGWSISGR